MWFAACKRAALNIQTEGLGAACAKQDTRQLVLELRPAPRLRARSRCRACRTAFTSMTIGKALTSSRMAFAGSVVADEFERNVTLRKQNAPTSSKNQDSRSV